VNILGSICSMVNIVSLKLKIIVRKSSVIFSTLCSFFFMHFRSYAFVSFLLIISTGSYYISNVLPTSVEPYRLHIFHN